MGIPLKLLLVEDSISDAEMAVSRLTQAGYDVNHRRVEDGSQMLLALQAQAWDVIIADYILSGFDSQQALRVLKSSGFDTPFIVLSGAMGEEIAVRAIKSGAYDYVLKNNLIPWLRRSKTHWPTLKCEGNASRLKRRYGKTKPSSETCLKMPHWVIMSLPLTG